MIRAPSCGHKQPSHVKKEIEIKVGKGNVVFVISLLGLG
jgi:hypothetical protein